jgi:hypothetical protein
MDDLSFYYKVSLSYVDRTSEIISQHYIHGSSLFLYRAYLNTINILSMKNSII